MQRTHERSEIKYIRAEDLASTNRVVLQVEQCERPSEKVHQMVIAEVVSINDYEHITVEGKLKITERALVETIEQLENVNEELYGLRAENIAQTEFINKNSNQITELHRQIQILKEALFECEKIFGDLPKEIERLISYEETTIEKEF